MSLQLPIKTRAARRCPSPAAPRARPFSTAPSAPPTGSAPPPPPPRPRPSPPRPAPQHQIRAQRRASRGGAPTSLSLQGVDRPTRCPGVIAGVLLPLQCLRQAEQRESLSASVRTLLFLMYYLFIYFLLGPFCTL